MKKIFITSFFVISASLLPLVTNAQDTQQSGDNSQIQNGYTAQQGLRPMPCGPNSTGGASATPCPTPTSIRERIRNDIRTPNIKANETLRNAMLQKMKSGNREPGDTNGDENGTSTGRRFGERGAMVGQDDRGFMMNASTTYRRGIGKDMMQNVFKIRMDAMIHEFGVALNNLHQIRDRISSRIDKAVSDGKDMTNAKTLLATADTKIKAAEQAIQALKDYKPSVITPTASSSGPTVYLEKPRVLGEQAKTALKEAREALAAVIKSIAQSLGVKFGNDHASTTPRGEGN